MGFVHLPHLLPEHPPALWVIDSATKTLVLGREPHHHVPSSSTILEED